MTTQNGTTTVISLPRRVLLYGQVSTLATNLTASHLLTHLPAWSGGLSIEDFIQVSKNGRAKGDFIMHRENGTLVDLNPSTKRAIGKMKATITQRFTIQGIQVDVECDCQFIFFAQKHPSLGWKTQYVKLFYEKDKIIPVDGVTVPKISKQELDQYPMGYQWLSVAQASLGHKILQGLPTLNNQGFKDLNGAMVGWLEGKEVGDMLGVPKDYKSMFGN